MCSYGFENNVVFLEEVNSNMIGVEQVQSPLRNLIQSRKHLTCRRDIIGNICQCFYNLGSPTLFLKESSIFDCSRRMVSQHFKQRLLFNIIGVGFIRLGGDHANDFVAYSHRYSYNRLNMPGRTKVEYLPLFNLFLISEDEAHAFINH